MNESKQAKRGSDATPALAFLPALSWADGPPTPHWAPEREGQLEHLPEMGAGASTPGHPWDPQCLLSLASLGQPGYPSLFTDGETEAQRLVTEPGSQGPSHSGSSEQ